MAKSRPKHRSKRYQGGGEASGMWEGPDTSRPSSFGAGFAQGMGAAAKVGAAGAALRNAMNKTGGGGGGGGGGGTNWDPFEGNTMQQSRRGGPTHPRGPKIGKEDGLIAAQKGEYVIRKKSAQKLGTKTLDHINRKGTLPGRMQGRGR
jgi:hypothetical protein